MLQWEASSQTPSRDCGFGMNGTRSSGIPVYFVGEKLMLSELLWMYCRCSVVPIFPRGSTQIK